MNKESPTLIGAFVLGGIALGLAGLVIFGSGKFLQQRAKVMMYFQGSVNGLSVGAPVKFKGVPIGQVSNIGLVIDEAEKIVAIPVIAEIDKGKLATDMGREVHLSEERIQELVEAGLRATLESQSMVTGLLFVGLDLDPSSDATVLPVDTPYPQIPTLPSTLEQFSETLTEVLKQVREVDLVKLMDGVTKTVDGMQKIVNSPEIAETLEELDATLHATRQVAEQINQAVGPVSEDLSDAAERASQLLKSLQKTVNRTNQLLQPNAPLVYQLQESIREIGAAARAVQELASMIDEQPTVLLYGKDSGEQE